MSKMHYLDYAAGEDGNPGAIHGAGRQVARAVALARQQIAGALNCEAEEIVFTGSATEADNLAVLGVARANKKLGKKILISEIEHKAVLACGKVLQAEGFEVKHLKVLSNGLVDLTELKKELATKEKTILVSVGYTDSETGTIQPIKEITRLAKTAGAYFHTDASQSAGYLDLDVKKLGVDLLTLSSHKIYGPKGVAGLFVRRGVAIQPIIYGGGQEGGLRSGTENVPGVVGFGKAVELSEKRKKSEGVRIKKLRDRLEKEIFKKIPRVILNGHPRERLPNFLNVSFLDIEGESLLLSLDDKGIMVSTGSACNAHDLNPSHVLLALGRPYEQVHGSIRFTLGRGTTEATIKYVMKHLPEAVARLRKISPMNLFAGQKQTIALPKAFVGGREPHFVKKQRNVKK